MEAVAQETAPLNIAFTIVEPGAAATGFSENKESAPPLAPYDETPSGEMRRVIAADAFVSPGDPAKMAQAMIDSVDVNPAPRRLGLGSDAYTLIRAALVERLAALDAQKGIAMSADRDAG